ncbi:MAG: hypothetical protein K2X35_14785 [Bryobacteraceae bacterium]|nr:hypothetical protein [Bryobacteraceae bacterium]
MEQAPNTPFTFTSELTAAGERPARSSYLSPDPVKGKKSTAKLAPGVASRQVKSLPQLYAEEGLPALTAPNPAELRMLAEHGSAHFAASVLSPGRKRKATPPKA